VVKLDFSIGSTAFRTCLILDAMRLLTLCVCAWIAALAHAEDVCVRNVSVPGYPGLAKQARIAGTAVVKADLNADGDVTAARATGAHPILDDAAERNLQQWKFCPADSPSFSVRHVTVTYVYRLAQPEENLRSHPHVVIDLPDRIEISAQPMQAVPFD